MGSLGGTRLVALLAAGCLGLAGCTGAGEEPVSGDASASDAESGDPGDLEVAGSQAAEPSGKPDREVLGVGFDVPAGWQKLQVDDIDPSDATARTVAEQLGVRPGQLERQLSTTELYLVGDTVADQDYLPTIDVYPVPGAVPADEQIEQDFARIGAEVGDLRREQTAAGEVAVVSYRLPTRDTTVEGASLVVPQEDQTLIITISEVDRARADEVADALVASLVSR